VKADVLIVDEALAVGDAAFTQKCMRFLHEFMREGTLIFVSHDMASVRSLCNKAIWLERGRIRMMGEPKIVGDAYLENCYAKQQDTALVVQNGQVSKESANAARPTQSQLPLNSLAQKQLIEQDFRLSMSLNPLQLLSVPSFEMSGFGAGKARITEVTLFDEHGQPLHQASGGKRVNLRIQAQMLANLHDVVFGYFVRNRLGLNIFGDNTYLAYHQQPVSAAQGDQLMAEFTFVMPFLPQGEYSVCAAVATGSNLEHEQQHWVHEAMVIRSVDNHVHADVLALPSVAMNIEKLA
jgi:lipopolysaccharide transport system ATP-binding protein